MSVRNGDFFSITDERTQHTDDLAVSDPVFPVPVMIAADHVVFFADFQYPVKDIFISLFVEDSIVSFQPSDWSGRNDHQILSLSQKRKHAAAHICIDKLSTASKFLFKR